MTRVRSDGVSHDSMNRCSACDGSGMAACYFAAVSPGYHRYLFEAVVECECEAARSATRMRGRLAGSLGAAERYYRTHALIGRYAEVRGFYTEASRDEWFKEREAQDQRGRRRRELVMESVEGLRRASASEAKGRTVSRAAQIRGDVPTREGDVRIWLLDQGRWAWRSVPDAREMLAIGSAAREEPAP